MEFGNIEPCEVPADKIIAALVNANTQGYSYIEELLDDDLLFQMHDVWETVHFAEGATPLSMAFFHWETTSPETIDFGLPKPEWNEVATCMAHVALYLASQNEKGEFYIPSRAFSEHMKQYDMKYSHVSTSTLKRRFVTKGYFDTVQQHTTKNSTVYRIREELKHLLER